MTTAGRCSAACCSSPPRRARRDRVAATSGRAANEPAAFWLLGAAHFAGSASPSTRQARALLAAAEAGVVEAHLELGATATSLGIGGAPLESTSPPVTSARPPRRAAPKAACAWPSGWRLEPGGLSRAVPVAGARGRRGLGGRRRPPGALYLRRPRSCPLRRGPRPSAGWPAPRPSAGTGSHRQHADRVLLIQMPRGNTQLLHFRWR